MVNALSNPERLCVHFEQTGLLKGCLGGLCDVTEMMESLKKIEEKELIRAIVNLLWYKINPFFSPTWFDF